MGKIPGSDIKANQYLPPTTPLTVPNLKLAIKLCRMNYSQEYIAEFVTGPWSPDPADLHPMESPCPQLSLPAKE